LLLPGAALRADVGLLARVEALLGLAQRRGRRRRPCRGAGNRRRHRSRNASGAFSTAWKAAAWWSATACCWRALRRWLPARALQGLGEALGNRPAIRRRIASADFYVIEPRAYHADHARLVAHYDGLRKESGCAMNLDLQRIAMPPRASGYPGLRMGSAPRKTWRRPLAAAGHGSRRASWSRTRPSANCSGAWPTCRCCTWPNWPTPNEEMHHA
jgi:hypothetical protein